MKTSVLICTLLGVVAAAPDQSRTKREPGLKANGTADSHFKNGFYPPGG
jgi:hypothetical protein